MREVEIDDLPPEEYAAQWGCDPVYDHPPREKGDGYLFYNYNVEINRPPVPRQAFLDKFIPAIQRTIADVQNHVTAEHGEDAAAYQAEQEQNLLDLNTLLAYVQEQRRIARWQQTTEYNEYIKERFDSTDCPPDQQITTEQYLQEYPEQNPDPTA